MSAVQISLISAPVVGFEQPFDMLSACHERVERSLDLLTRLIDHVRHHGHDERSRSAATDVLRYFDLAAPNHHEDEERHVFPALLALGDPALSVTVQQLIFDHLQMQLQWARLRPLLQDWATPAPGVDIEALNSCARPFVALYGPHLHNENEIAYPRARLAMSNPQQVEAMGAEMQQRRQAA